MKQREKVCTIQSTSARACAAVQLRKSDGEHKPVCMQERRSSSPVRSDKDGIIEGMPSRFGVLCKRAVRQNVCKQSLEETHIECVERV